MNRPSNTARIVTIAVLLLVLALGLLLARAYDETISLNKNEFLLGETVDISINTPSLENISVDLLTPSSIYKYVTPSSKLKYRVSEPGTYRINVYLNKDLLVSKAFYVVEEQQEKPVEPEPIVNFNFFSIEKNNYTLGEYVIIYFNQSLMKETYSLVIISGSQRFNYLNSLGTSLRFVPRQKGIYEAQLFDGSTLLEVENFVVQEYCGICEQINETNETVSLVNHTLSNITQPENESIDFVQDIFSLSNESRQFSPEQLTFKITNSKGYYLFTNVTISRWEESIQTIENKTGKAVFQLSSFSQGALPNGKYNLSFNPEFSGINKLEIIGLNYNGNFELGLEDISPEEIELPGVKTRKAFAVDSSKLEFNEGSMEVESVGYQLYKCKDWNFTEQRCFGKWEFQRFILPGETYRIEINSTDPGYAEVGLASINTERSIYHPNESVRFTIVVLDNNGYLVDDAEVNLSIQSPENITFILSTQDNNIIQVKKGIYEAQFSDTNLTGRYLLYVSAYGNNVNNEMFSYFDVQEYYEFEILRHTPVTLDPFKNSLFSSIWLYSYSGIENFSFSEKLPRSFIVEDLGGSMLSLINSSNYLTWYNLSNNSTISYTAKVPEISPALYELQGFVTYSNNIFNEARPWFLTADPATNRYITYSDCTGWSDIGPACPSPNRGELPGDTNYTCTYTDTLPSNAVPLSINVTVLQVTTVCDGTNINVAMGNYIMGQINNEGPCDCILDSTPSPVFAMNISKYNIGGSNRIDLDPTASSRHAIKDDGSNNVIRLDISYTTRPNITNLNYPSNQMAVTKGRVDFNFTVIDDTAPIKNCTLYGNFGGTFEPNTTITNVANNTNTNITLYLNPGRYTWNIYCYDNDNVIGYFPQNYTVFVTKKVDMFYPDRAAPGMSVVMHITGEEFNISELIQMNSSDIVIGPITITNQTGYVVNNNGYVIQVPLFIKSTAATQNVSINISRAIPSRRFEIITPSTGSGNFTGLSGTRTLGNGGIDGERSFYGAIILDSLIIPAGLTVNVTINDPDGIASNGNQGLLPAIILVKGPVNIQGALRVNGETGYNNPTSHGGFGGPGGGGGGAGGKTGVAVTGGNGGSGIAGGGAGGVEGGTGGTGGSGTGAAGSSNSGTSGGRGGDMLFGNLNTSGAGGVDAGTGGDGGGGATGFFYGLGGYSGTYSGGINSLRGLGGGGGAGSNSESDGGGGGGFGTSGSDAVNTVSTGTGNERGAGGSITGSPQLIPLAGGSGGGGGSADEGGDDREGGGGAGGGGSVLIISPNYINVGGQVSANGGNGGTGEGGGGGASGGGGGSGGSIILQSYNITVVSAGLSAAGGTGGPDTGSGTAGGAGGEGRVRVDGMYNLTIPGTLTSEFIGPALYEITNDTIRGRANASAFIDIILQSSSGLRNYYTTTANASGDFNVTVSFYNGYNYLFVKQNTSSNTVSVQSPAAMRQYTYGTTPSIISYQCEINSAGNWQTCSNLVFGTTLLQARANCTIFGNQISNVTFKLENIPDSNTFFDNTTTNNSTGYWVFDNSNLLIDDSGDFRLTVTCLSNESISQVNTTTWNVPWGRLNSTLIWPNASTIAGINATFNFTSLITCVGGECGDVNATLDPYTNWDDENYNYRQKITLTESSGVARTNTHFFVNFTLVLGRLNATKENSTVMYCNATRMPWDAYAVATSGNWITRLEGLGEINLSASSTQTCYIYLDPDYAGTELLPAYTGWMMAEQDKPGGVVCSLADSDVTNPNCFEYFSSISYSGAGVFDWCTSGDYETYIWNSYCYFKAPTTETETFGTRSDDSSYLYVNGSLVVDHGAGCQAATDASGTYPIIKGRYYPTRVLWNENGGSEEARLFYNSTTYAGAGRNDIDAECYPYIGDEWSLSVISEGIEYKGKSIISTTPGAQPFWTLSANPSTPSQQACLRNMISGNSCQTTWVVNSTGQENTTWEFFVIYRSLDYPTYVFLNLSRSVNITIVLAGPPFIANVLPNNEAYGFGQRVSILATVQDADGISTVKTNITLPDSTMITQSMSLLSGNDYYYYYRPWQHGSYYFSIYANDTTGEYREYDPYFYIYGNASMTLNVEKETYNTSERVYLTGTNGSAWWNYSFNYRQNVTIIEPQNLARANTHIILNFTLAEQRLGNENGSALICNNTRVLWDAYALTTSNGWITSLQGLAEINISAGQKLSCHLYYDPAINLTEMLPSATGWNYVCDNNYASCGTPGDVTPANYDVSGHYASLNSGAITCGGDAETFTQNSWCYFKAPRTASITFATASDDGSNLYLNGAIVVNNQFCQGTTCRSAASSVTAGRYYSMSVNYDENTGSNTLYALYDPTVCGSGVPTGDILDSECYPYYGDEWLLTTITKNEELLPSELKDTGSTNISGYLLMLVQFNSSGIWQNIFTVLNDTKTGIMRNISVGSFINLATLWNPISWNTSLGIGGQYRAYSEFTDPYGNILRNDDNSSINATDIFRILNNPPYVVSVSLLPVSPGDNINLNCSFVIGDYNWLDTLTANVTWYNNNVANLTITLSVTNGGQASTLLGEGNTTPGDIWHCGITPYDTIDYGNQVNSSRRTIQVSEPPIITSIECQENWATWQACSNIQYYDALTSVRAACTDTDGSIQNVTFNLTNIQDRYLFFSNTTTDNSTEYYVYDNDDINITDSGNFNLTVICIDDTNVTTTNISSWFIPFGTRTIELLDPTTNRNVTQSQLFNFNVRITCTGGECGTYNASLDPPVAWDNKNYGYRLQVNMTEPQALRRINDHIRFNVSIAEGKFPLRAENTTSLYCNGTRIPWDAYSINTSSTWINKLEGIAELSFSASETRVCYLYYDTNYTTTELQPSVTGWRYACDNNYAVCGTPGDVTPANMDFNSTYATLNLAAITCGSDTTTFTHNLWCYFKAPSSGVQTLATASDDGSMMYIEGTTVASNNFCQGVSCRSGTYNFTAANRYYDMKVTYDQSGGGAALYAYYNPTSCPVPGAGSGTVIGSQCYPYMGDEWAITVSKGVEEGPKGLIAVNGSATPFYTIHPNPFRPINEPCLENMGSGSTCTLLWIVNATGPVNSTHRFYTEFTPWNYTGYTGPDYSAVINITIIGNLKPVVISINLTPLYPIPSDNLTCNFVVTDNNLADFLTANFSWYRDGIVYNSSIMNVTNGILNTVILNSSNLGVGEDWFCSVLPYDQNLYGDRRNSSTVNILTNRPPTVSLIECQRDSSTWGVCSNIIYNSNLTGVRARCSDVDGFIINATFNFTNYPDNRLYFSSTTSDNSTYPTYFYLNNNDINIRDSGTFNLTVTCRDNNATEGQGYSQWNIAWGTLTSTLVSPSASTTVQKDAYFNFTARVSCSGGECGSVNFTLDPDTWHNSSFRYRVSVNLTEPLALGRNNTHFFINITLEAGRLSNENGTLMYCNGNRIPWDAYAINSSGGWVTKLQGLGEINITPSQTQRCYVYLDPIYNATEFLPNVTGWSRASAISIAGGSVVDLTPAQITCYEWNFTGDVVDPQSVCGYGDIDNFKINQWCYFKAPTSNPTNYFKTGSDDGSIMYVNDVANVLNDGLHSLTWVASTSTVNITSGRYYALETGFAENGGDQQLYNRWNAAAGGGNNGESINGACYPFFGDEWLLTTRVGGAEEIYKTVIPVNGSAVPFYTIYPNPVQPINYACLENMTSGTVCTYTWTVNATGALNSTHIFYVITDPINYSAYVSQANSTKITITITDASKVAPLITLNSPLDNNITNNPVVNFNCSATDNLGLVSMSLYADFNGSFMANETQSSSGLSDTKVFTKTLSDGIYKWTCQAYDTDGNSGFGPNRTVTVDTTAPNISLYKPDGDIFYTGNIWFNYTVSDNIDSSLICSITVDSTERLSNIVSANNTVINRNISSLDVNIHTWYVTCYDDAGNINSSVSNSFTILDLPPSIVLLTRNGTYFTSSSISLYFNASDNFAIWNATLYINNEFNQTRYDVENGANETFNLTNVAEGRYEWYINVTDTSNLSVGSSTRVFFVDFTPPTINITYPLDELTTDQGNISINFTIIDNLASTSYCDIRVNSTIVDYNFSVANNTPKIRSIIFPDGISFWNITCRDVANNSNTTLTRWINVSAAPNVTLYSPASGYTQQGDSLYLYYIPRDNSNLSKCELILNGAIDQINTTIKNNAINNFSLSALSQSIYLWQVNCTDNVGLNALSETRNFTIDALAPTITLYYLLPNATVLGPFQYFNFTVVDNFDDIMICNMSVDSSKTGNINFNSTNNTVITRNFTTSSEGLHFWYVECLDNAGNYIKSETRNFTTNNPPTITLISPSTGTILSVNNINLSYIPYDSGTLVSTLLILNGMANETNPSPVNNELNNFTLTSLLDGYYNWTVNATDNDGLTGIAGSIWTFIIDTTAPSITPYFPSEGTTVTTNALSFNFSAIENLAFTFLCNVTTNNSAISQNLNVTNNSIVKVYKNLTDGNYNWYVNCIDFANNTGVITPINYIVEAPPSVSLISPNNNTRSRNQSYPFAYIPSDPFGLYNCTVLLDGNLNESSSSIINGQQNSLFVSGITEGFHNWTVECLDAPPDLNPYAPPPRYLRVDLSGPAIVLHKPGIDETYNTNNVTFNYTAYETDNVMINCNLTVTDAFGTRINTTQRMSGIDHIITVVNLSDGDHYWNVTCIDDLGNANTSETWRFIINQPDLFINASKIRFNNSNPDLYENITIIVNVSNLGGQPANNLYVTFYNGDPQGGGTFLGDDTDNVGINQTRIFSTTWLIPPGYHTIYVSVDPYDAIPELNETNNNATKHISVLWVNITYPQNATWWNSLTVPFNFSARDYTGGSINYTVLVDNNPNGQNGSLIEDSIISLDITFAQGAHSVKIRANDSLGRIKDSVPVTVYIDITPPVITFNTQNLTWFNYTNPRINFTITDNLDTLVNYTLFVNGIIDITGAANSSMQSIILSDLQNGTHYIIIEALDEAGNRINSTTLTIYVDTVEPTIALIYPADGYNIFVNYTDLNFTVLDNIDSLLTCNLTLDSSINASNINVLNNTINRTRVVGLREGTHYWNVTCWDGNSVTPVNMKNTSETRSFNIYTPPLVTLITPLDNNWTNQENVTFFYNVSDETGIENCSILLNGAIQDTKTTSQIFNRGTNNFTLNYLNGTYLWVVECYDNTTMHNYATTNNRTLNIDLDSPEPYIQTQSDLWFNYNTPSIAFNITDNMDNVLNYTFYANSSLNRQGTINNASPLSVNLLPLADGVYVLTLEALDEAYNRKNSTPINIFVDTTKPIILLSNPENGNSTIDTNIFFNFTAYDNLAQTMLCNLTVDRIVRQNFNVTPGFSNFTYIVMNSGTHFWNVTCIDTAGNINTSQTWNFTIPLPDLTVTSADIMFNTTLVEEGKNITINATIYNIGETDAQNVLIQFFEGNYNLSRQINGNFTYNFTAGSNITLNVTWQVSGVGTFDIYVVVDPPIASGGNIVEINESNNYAFNRIEVGSYSIVYGNLTGLLNIRDLTNRTLYQWNVTDYNSTKIYAVDFDSNVNWARLQAISRDTSNGFVVNDFRDIDLALRMENNTDSVNATWTLNNNPRLTNDYSVYLRPLSNVPVVNSTNTSNFLTGILWDTGDGNTQYNGTQDLVFMTTVNVNQQGKFGIYDYELKIPANLRIYKNPNLVTVALYTELP